MSGSELDPLFMKGLRLLHSKSKDSTEQLKQLLEEAIAQSKQSTQSKDRIYTSVKLEGESKLHIKKAPREAPDITGFNSKYPSEEPREKKTEKRPLEKNKPDSLEVEAKIPKLEPPQVYSYYPSSPDIPKLDQYDTRKEKDTDSSDEKEDADDFAMEMGLACVICHSLDVTQGNQLIECQECHSLYHQECHRPPATDYDYNDPRRVWYCAKCIKNMKKMATKSQKSAKSSPTCPIKESVSLSKPSKADNSPPSLMLPFKRAEPKATLTQGNNNNQSGANKPIGLAGLAANFGNRSASSSTSSSLASATRGAKPTTSTSSKVSFTATTKATSLSSSGSLSKSSTSGPFSTSSQSSSTSSFSSSQKTSTTTTVTKGLGLLSAAVAASSATTSSRSAATAATSASTTAAATGNGNKAPSCSPLMSADKRLQIMKKKASKMQERRRMSNK